MLGVNSLGEENEFRALMYLDENYKHKHYRHVHMITESFPTISLLLSVLY